MAAEAKPALGNGTAEYPEWNEDGTNRVTPSAGEKLAGNAANGVASSSKLNWLFNLKSRWARFFHKRHVRGDTGLVASWVQAGTGFPSAAGTLSSTSVYTEVLVAGILAEIPATTKAFTASRDTYVAVNEDGTLEYNEVPNLDPAPTPSAGYVHYQVVVTDGSQVTTTTLLLPTKPQLDDIQAKILRVERDDDGVSLTAVGGNTSGEAISATGKGGKAGVVSTGGATGPGLRAVSVSAEGGVQAVNSNGGPGVDATGNGAGAGVQATGGATGHGVEATAGGGTTHGVKGTGGNGASSRGVQGQAAHADGIGVEGLSHASGTASGYGVKGTGQGAAHGVLASVVANSSGYALYVFGDQTSPINASCHIAPQDAQPSKTPNAADEGDLYANSVDHQLHYRDNVGYRTLHQSPYGFCGAAEKDSAGGTTSTAGGPVTLASAQINAYSNQSGRKVVIVASVAVTNFSADDASCTFDIYDSDAGAVVPGSARTVRTKFSDLGTELAANPGAPHEAVALTAVYTLPAAGSRTFLFRVTSVSGTVTWADESANIAVMGAF